MNFLLVLAIITPTGVPIIISQPAHDQTECGAYMQEFIDAQPEVKYDAVCYNVLSLIATEKRDS